MIFLLLLVIVGPFLLGTITRLEADDDDDGSCFRSIKRKRQKTLMIPYNGMTRYERIYLYISSP